jgi:cell division protein FtsI (penicillin-binding protein 3)
MLIVAVLIVWIGGISARLVYLQVNQHEWLKGKASSQRIDVKQTKMLRGSIFDRNERALAVSVMSKTLFADATQIEDINKTAEALAKALNTNKARIAEQLSEAKDLEKRFVPIAKGLDDIEAQAINTSLETDGLRKSDLPKYTGLHWREEQKRTYPHNSLAAHIIGFSNNDGVGQAGIEQSQNEALFGQIIKKTQERDRLGRIYDETVSEKEPAKDIVLTISNSIQYKTEQALEKAVKASAATAGMAIVLDHTTGEILAMANYPTFDPNRLEMINASNLSNRSIQGMYAPGSVFKLITYSSAFENNLLTPDSNIEAGNGVIDVAGHVFRDKHASGSVNVTKAFADSSNICAIKTSMKVGRDGFYTAMQKYGFGKQTGIELPAETRGVLRHPSKWYGDSLASMSIGYELGVSALQMTSAFATIANNGVRVQPHIIKEIRQSDQTKVFESQPESERTVSQQTADRMKTLMRAVVTDGTGKAAQLNGYTSAGKTGTAWKFDEKTKRVSSAKYISSFIGFAPVDSPKFTIAVIMDEPKIGGRNGGQVAAPVFKEIAESVLAEMRVPFDLTADAQPVDSGDVVQETIDDLDAAGITGSKGDENERVDKKKTDSPKAGKSTEPKDPNDKTVTDRPKVLALPKKEKEKAFSNNKDKFKT